MNDKVRNFRYIVAHPAILGGKPCIKGTRISVAFILELLASGATFQDILQTYAHVPAEGLAEALHYAAYFLQNEFILTAEAMIDEPARVSVVS